MKCVICGKELPKLDYPQSCSTCNVELVDDQREADLRRRLQEVITALEELEKNRIEGNIDEDTFHTIDKTLDNDKKEIETELSAVERKRKQLRSNWVKSRMGEVALLYERGMLDEAYTSVHETLQVEPNNPSAHVVMAKILSFKGYPEEAVRAARYAQSLDPSNMEIAEYVSQLEAWYQQITQPQRVKEPQVVTREPENYVEKTQRPVSQAPTPQNIPGVSPQTQYRKAYVESRTRHARPKRKKPDLTGWIKNLVDRGFLKWWYFVGTFILLAGIIGLVTWQWGVIGKYFVFFLVFTATAGLFMLGHFLSKRIKLGSTIIFVIASFLVPLDIFLFNYYAIGGGSYNINMLGIAGSIIGAVIYGLNFYRTRNLALFAFLTLTPLSLLFFILRGSGISAHYYGLWFVGMATGYFICGYMLRRNGLSTYARVLYAVANATILVALFTMVGDIDYYFREGFKATGVMIGAAAASLVIGSYAYQDRILAYLSSGLIVVATYFLAQEPGAAWYLAAPYITLAAGVLLIMGYLDSTLAPEHDGRPFIHAGLATILVTFTILLLKDCALNLPAAWSKASGSEMLSSIVTAALIAALLWIQAFLEKKKDLGYLASSAFVYASVVFVAYTIESLPVWCLIEATVVAGFFMILGLVLEKTADMEWALTAYIPGFVVAGVSTVAALIYYMPAISGDIIPDLALYDYAYISASLTTLATTIYLVIATVRTRRPHWLYAACATGIMAYAVQIHAVSSWDWVRNLSGGGVNYGMLFLPLLLLLWGAGHLMKRTGHEELSIPLFVYAAGASTFPFIAQFYYISQGASVAAAITFAVYMIILSVEAVLWERGEFLYPAILSTFLMGFEVIRLTLTGTGVEMNYPLLLTPIAAVLAFAGLLLVRSDERQKYAVPMLVSTAVFAAVGFIKEIAYMSTGLEYSVSIYLFTWSIIGAITATLAGIANMEGWKSYLPEILAHISLGHLALGVGYLAYIITGDFAVVALIMAGLCTVLSVAHMVIGKRLPHWLERPLQYGAAVVGTAAVICSLVYPAWDIYYANVISVAVLTAALICIDFVAEDRLLDRLALGVYAGASLFSVLVFNAITEMGITKVALAWQCGSLAVMAAAAIAASEHFIDEIDHIAGHFFAILAWLGLGWLLNLYPAYLGYWLIAPAVVIAITSYLQYLRDLDQLALVGWIASAGLLAAAVIYPMAIGATTQAIVILSMALVVAGVSVVMYGREELTYLPLAVSVVETIYILAVYSAYLSTMQAGLIIMGPALIYLAIGWLLADAREGVSNIFLQFCAGMTALGTVYAVYGLLSTGTGDIYLVATLFTAGIIYAALGIVKDYPFMGHISFAHCFAAYILVLTNWDVPSPHLYFLPMGIYLIALGYYCEYRGYSVRTVRLLHLTGFTTLALSSLIPSIGEVGGFHAMILLSESLAALVVGVWQRRKVFLGAGMAFIIIDGIVRLWSPAGSLHWSIYAILVGSLVIIAGILIETKREVLVEKGAAMLHQLKTWK